MNNISELSEYISFHPNPKKPDISLPPGACDAHCHVFGPSDKFPYSPKGTYTPVDAPKEVLFEMHRYLGIDRGVIVQASCHGTDNSAMIDALKSAGESYRGIAVVAPDVSKAQLARWHEFGVRGVRFNFVKRLKARQSEEVRDAVIGKITGLPWHVVTYFEPADLSEIHGFFARCPLPVIIDHMGCVSAEGGTSSREFEALARLLEDERFWIKLSCPERISTMGSPYKDTDEIAQELLRIAPNRVLWGTDWPHPNMTAHAPDDGLLVDRLSTICSDEPHRHGLLVDNPAYLYWN